MVSYIIYIDCYRQVSTITDVTIEGSQIYFITSGIEASVK